MPLDSRGSEQGRSARPSFLIVEDDRLVGRALLGAVRTIAGAIDGRVVTTVADARAALASSSWTGIVIDVGLPDGSGLELLRELRERRVPTPALVTTGRYDPAIANAAYELRAACVFKPDLSVPIKLFVQRVLSHGGSPEERRAAALRSVARSYALTQREVQVVEHLVAGVPREGLAEALGVTENTVKTLLRHVLDKCGQPRAEALTRWVLEQALQLDA